MSEKSRNIDGRSSLRSLSCSEDHNLHQRDIEKEACDPQIQEEIEKMANEDEENDMISIKAGPANSTSPLDLQRNRSHISNRFVKVASILSTRSKLKNKMARPKVPEMNLAENLIGWESQTDPDLPLNFSPRRKWFLLCLTSAMNFMVALASAMIAPGVSLLSTEFNNTSDIKSTLTVTIFLLGFAVGPILLSPLSEMYGRKIVMTCGNTYFALWQIGCALAPNINSMIIFRFLAGTGGSASLTIGAGLISDLFDTDMRGTASSIYAAGTLFGPILGPILGGLIAQDVGWRWVFWVLFIATTLLIIAMEIWSRETSHLVLMKWKVEKLRKEYSNPNLRSAYDVTTAASTPSQLLITSVARPLKMLFFSPILFILATYMAFVYGLQYLFSTTIPDVFQSTYGWEIELTGLAYIGLGVGFFAGVLIVARINDATVVRLTKANDGVFEPEMRLPACVGFACFIPISFFWYGWSTYYKLHWSIPIVGLIPFGIGQIGVFIPIQTYVIDTYSPYAASGVASLTIMRSALGAVLPLAGPKMFDSLGLGWGNSVLGFVAVALIPFPALIYKFGGAVRKKYPYKF